MTRKGGNGDPPVDAPGHDPATYGDLLGADYDRLYPAAAVETDVAVDFIADLAQRHPSPSVLEFGIGTGRLAIPLHRRGLQVAGIEASPSMVAVLREKDSGARIEVAVGDYVSTRIARSFSVVALVFNGILDERGMPAQLALFENAARHLDPGGYFVVEAFVLSDQARDGSWTVWPRYVGADHVELQMARFDIETSTLERTLVHLLPRARSSSLSGTRTPARENSTSWLTSTGCAVSHGTRPGIATPSPPTVDVIFRSTSAKRAMLRSVHHSTARATAAPQGL